MVQLGSSLRVVGDAASAITVHQKVAAQWPHRAADHLFLALALLEAGEAAGAVAGTFSVALQVEDDDVAHYRRALTEYGEQLQRTSS